MNWFKYNLGPVRTVIVHTKTDQTIRGMLADKRSDHLIIRPASIANFDQNGALVWKRIDGDVVIMLDNVDFWQEGVDAISAGLTPELFED